MPPTVGGAGVFHVADVVDVPGRAGPASQNPNGQDMSFLSKQVPRAGRGRIGRVALVASVVLAALVLASSPSRGDVGTFCSGPIAGTQGPGAGSPPTAHSPYPAPIVVSGLTGAVTDVNVTLDDVVTVGDFNSTTQHWVEDIDVMLSAPAPSTANLVLMSDVGGDSVNSQGPVNADVVLDDQAAVPLPADTHLTSGTYRPLDDDDDPEEQVPGPDLWVSPAPAPSSATTLATFNGINPNGTWNVWIVDDFGQGATNIGNVCLQITTSGTATTTTSTTTTTLPPTTTTSSTTTTVAPTTTTSSTTTTVAPTTTTSSTT